MPIIIYIYIYLLFFLLATLLTAAVDFQIASRSVPYTFVPAIVSVYLVFSQYIEKICSIYLLSN